MASPRSAWGIDIGNRALKAVHLIRTPDGIKIDDFEIIEHETILSQAGDNRESLIQSALANFAQRHNIKGQWVGAGVSGQSSFARFIKLPPVEPKKVPEIVRFEAIQQIPFPLDDVEWSYQLFQNPESPDVEVGIFAMRKELVNHHMQYFTQTGLNVQVVQMTPLADYNALYYDDKLDGPTMIVDVGAENTDLIIADGETIWLRSIPIGGNAFTETLVKAFKLKYPKAEELKRNAATSKYGRQILQAMRPIFADLVAEIQRSIGFYASVHRESRISRVLTLGGTFRLPGLQKYLQQNLQLDLVRVDHFNAGQPNDARLAALFSENILSCVSAYGLALQALGEAKIGSSLLPAAIRRERMWKDKTKYFGAAAALFVLGSAIPLATWYLSDLKMKDDAVANDTKIRTVQKQGDDLDAEWKQLTGSGEADRTQIAAYGALQNYRDFWNVVTPELVNSFTPRPSTQPDELKRVERSKRNEVLLDSWKARYVGPAGFPTIVSLPEEAFRLQVDQNSAVPIQAAAQQSTDGSSSDGSTPAPPPPPPPPPPVPGGLGGGPVATGPRGFLVTMRCITPNAAGSRHIAQTLVEALKSRNVNDPKNPTHLFSVDRVSIVTEQKLGSDSRWAARRVSGRPGLFRPATPTTPTPPAPYGGGYGGAGFIRPGMQPPPPPVDFDPYRDPITGEDMHNDAVVTVLVAISMEPKPNPPPTPPPAPAAAAPAAGDATAPLASARP